MADETENIEEVEGSADEAPVADSTGQLEAARQRFGEVIGGVEKRVQGLREGAGRASQRLKEGAERASTVARDRYDVARENVRQSYGRVSKDLEQLGEDVNEYVRHNPGKAVAIALGVGFVLGILIHRRRD
jgi:ElaB/YqjD/DUF883 family membrane-anchored ribosome-binding protein